MTSKGKRYVEANDRIDQENFYGPQAAIALVKENSTAKFDETIEIHMKTGLDPRHAEEQIRGSAVLPHGLGKEVRVAVFAEGEAARDATENGAEIVGGDDLIKKVEGGFVDFDAVVATRDMMGKISRLGRILGPRGLMPNPRAGTVVAPEDIVRSVSEAKRGRIEFRLDKLANIHVPLGKASFPENSLEDNLATFIEALQAQRPEGGKGIFIKSAALTSTMGPAIPLDINQTLAMKVN